MDELPKIALERMRISNPSESHPEAEMLNAFAENALGDKERGHLTAHLAQCPDCREIMMLALPEATNPQAVLVPASLFWRRPAFRWVALTACAALILAGVSARHFGEHRSIGDVAQAVPSQAARRVAPMPPASIPASEVSAQKAPSTPNQRNRATSAGNNQSPAVPVESFVPSTSRDSARVTARTTLNLNPRWTLTEDGALQRSLDSGKTWSPVSVAPNAAFRAVAASGQRIWVGGQKGSLYSSLDAGQTWSHVQPLAGSESLADDITNIVLTDDHHVSLGTVSATWVSSDSGQTWQKK